MHKQLESYHPSDSAYVDTRIEEIYKTKAQEGIEYVDSFMLGQPPFAAAAGFSKGHEVSHALCHAAGEA